MILDILIITLHLPQGRGYYMLWSSPQKTAPIDNNPAKEA